MASLKRPEAFDELNSRELRSVGKMLHDTLKDLDTYLTASEALGLTPQAKAESPTQEPLAKEAKAPSRVANHPDLAGIILPGSDEKETPESLQAFLAQVHKERQQLDDALNGKGDPNAEYPLSRGVELDAEFEKAFAAKHPSFSLSSGLTLSSLAEAPAPAKAFNQHKHFGKRKKK